MLIPEQLSRSISVEKKKKKDLNEGWSQFFVISTKFFVQTSFSTY